MRVIADTNLLIRLIVEDDPAQCLTASRALSEATVIAIGTSAFCELVWVLGRGYRFDVRSLATAVRRLVGARGVTCDREAIQAGLTILDAGGDFADGVIAHEGARLGGETFVSFDRKAVRLRQAQGHSAPLLS